MDKLGVAFIGSGFIARFIAQSWTGVRGADITAVYNPHENGAKKLAAYVESLGLPGPRSILTSTQHSRTNPSMWRGS